MDITRELVEADRTIPANLRRNAVINGAFDIWQRGGTFNITGGGQFTADRWIVDRASSTAGSITIERESVVNGDNAWRNGNGKFALGVKGTGLSGGTASCNAYQRIEDVRTFAGETVTLSYTISNLNAEFTYRVQLVQNFGTGGTASSQVIKEKTVTVPNGRSNVVETFELDDIGSKLIGTDGNDRLEVVILKTDAGYNPDVVITAVQLELGNRATSYERKTVAEELSLCQRYYEYIGGMNINGIQYTQNGDTRVDLPFKVVKRKIPNISVAGTLNTIAQGKTADGLNIVITPESAEGTEYGITKITFTPNTTYQSFGVVVSFGGTSGFIFFQVDAEIL